MKRTASILIVMLTLSGSWAYGQQADANSECTDQRLLQIIWAQKENYSKELALSEAAERDIRERHRQWIIKATTPEATQAWQAYIRAFSEYCRDKKEYHEGVRDTLRAILAECYPDEVSLLEGMQ